MTCYEVWAWWVQGSPPHPKSQTALQDFWLPVSPSSVHTPHHSFSLSLETWAWPIILLLKKHFMNSGDKGLDTFWWKIGVFQGDLFSGLSFVYFISLPCPTPWTPRPTPSFGLIPPHNFFSQSVPFMLPHSRYSNEVHQAPLVLPLYPARGLPATVVSHLRGTIIDSLLVSLLLPVPTP